MVSMLRSSWLILLTGEPELGEAALLAQLVGERPLHLRQRPLGDADLVGAAATG